MDRYAGYKVKEFLLVGVILIQALDFFKLLPPFWDYVNKIVNWVLIGAILYAASPSDILFGERRKWWDASLILACFAMSLKNIVSFAETARQEMLDRVMEYVAFVPAPEVKGAIVMPVSEAAYNTFTVIGGYLPNASMVAKPFATQLTIGQPTLAFSLQAAGQSAGAVLQPYGLDGMTLQIYNTIVNNAATIEQGGFIIGAVTLIALGLYAALNFKVYERSLLSVLHEGGQLKDLEHAIIRAATVLITIAAYFAILFSLAVEWLAMAVDAPFAMLGIVVVAYIMLRARNREERNVIDRMGNFGNDFLEGFGKLFNDKRTVLLGLSGLLVLHLITDVGAFLIPYATGLIDPLYFSKLGPGHEPLYTIISSSLTGSIMVDIATLILYTLNLVGILALFLLPVYIWYKAFKIRTRPSGEEEHLHHPNLPAWLVSLGITSVTAFLVAPAFKVKGVTGVIVGVDIQTHAITTPSPLIVTGVLVALFISLFLVTSLSKSHAMALLFVAAMAFFGFYVVIFFLAAAHYYLHEAISLLQQGGPASLFLGVWLFIFLVINMIFYVFGYFSFVYEAAKE